MLKGWPKAGMVHKIILSQHMVNLNLTEREHKFSSKKLCSRMEEAPVTPDFDSSSYAAPCNCIDIGVPMALAS